MAKSTVCGVRVAVWGARPGGHQGLGHHLESELFGGNCGHVAMSLTIPVTPENTEMIKKYCSHPPIPVEKQIVKIPKAKQDENGNWVPDHDAPPAHEEEVYTITFSWWPGSGAFFLNPSINSDGYDERIGVHREWDPRFREFIEVEERVHAGKIARTKMTYSALNVEHSRDLALTSDQRKYLNIKAQEQMLTSVAQSLKVGINKIEGKQSALDEIKKRKAGIENKEVMLSEKQKDITLLMALRSSFDNDATLDLSDKEKVRLNELYPDWETLNDKTKAKGQRKKVKAEIDSKIDNIKKSIARIKSDSSVKIELDEKKLLKPTETEMIVFDRFIPSWRAEFEFDKNHILSAGQYNQLLERARELRKSHKEAIVKMNDELTQLDYVNLPPEAKDVGYRLKMLNSDKAKFTSEKKILKAQLAAEQGLTDIVGLHDFFFDTYLLDDSDQYLKERNDCVNITETMKEKLDEFTAKTGIDWQTIVRIEEDREVPRISKAEIDKIDDILFNHLKKIEALSFFEQYLNPDNPQHLKRDDVLKIDDKIMAHLKFANRYANKDWEKFVADTSQITRHELKKLMKATIDHKSKIEKATDPLMPFIKLSDFFIDTYFKKKSDQYLKKDHYTVDIEGKLKKRLDEFTELTGIDWKTLVEIEEDREVPLVSKEELNKIDDILYNHIKKVEALRYFEQFTNPLNPRYLKTKGKLKIDDDVKEYLEHAQRYSGQSWRSYVSDPDKNFITKQEILHLIETTNNYQLEIEINGNIPKTANKADNQKKINELQAQIVKQNEKIRELNQEINNLEMDPALVKYRQFNKSTKDYITIQHVHVALTDILEDKVKEDLVPFEIDDELAKNLDNAYQLVTDVVNWREHFFGSPVPDPLMANIEVLKDIQEHLAKQLKDRYANMLSILPTRDCFSAQEHESFLTMGLPPEIEYRLRLDSDSLENGEPWGMSAEAMLAQMQSIVTEGVPFNLNVNNCSVTVGKVLEAGAKGEHLKSQFRNKALGAIATPQTIANNTEDYMKALNVSPKDSLFKRIARWNPIEKAIGKQVHTALSPNSSKGQKSNAWIKAGAISLASSPLVLLKGLLTPSNTFRNALHLIKFANSKDHVGFKVGAYIVGGLGMAVFAAPALLETIVKAPFKAIKWIADKIKSNKIRKENVHVDMSEKELSMRGQKESQLKANLSEIDKNITTIQANHPIQALEDAEYAIRKGKIISFNVKTRLLIENHIQHHKDPQRKAELQQRYTDIVNHVANKIALAVKQANESIQSDSHQARKSVRFSIPERQTNIEPEQQPKQDPKSKITPKS